MFLSDVSVKRPVLATVGCLLLVVFGVLSYLGLPLREYPDVTSPVVSVTTLYRGASANIIESRITQLIEDQLSGIEGVRSISSDSQDGVSSVSVEFSVERDIDDAANDVRDGISRIVDNLPEEAESPEIYKVDANSGVMMWLNLSSTTLDGMELTDYARRYLVDRLSSTDGVARVIVGGARDRAMRIWLDHLRLAAHDLTVADVESALRQENVELPAGRVEGLDRELVVRVDRGYRSVEDFENLVIDRGPGGYLLRLGEVGRVELAPEDDRSELRGNGEPMIGLGIVRQSTANALAVARGVKAEARRIQPTLPPGTELHQSYDTSVFVEDAIAEVFVTLGIAIALVILVIYGFLGDWRATIVPAVTVPVSVVATFIALRAFGFSINLFTLLALVLAIGLIVDDTIVVVENIHRRMKEGEPPLLAAYRGTRQVGFAVIATTMVLVAVFVPLAFLGGNIGRLFVEFALALAAAVSFSSLVALTLSPVLAARLLRANAGSAVVRFFERQFERSQRAYGRLLDALFRRSWVVVGGLVAVLCGITLLARSLPVELAPEEDRGAFFVIVDAPEGTSFAETQRYMRQVEAEMMPLVERGEATRALVRVPRSFNSTADVSSGIGIIVLSHWDERERSGQEIMGALAAHIGQIPGIRAFPVMRQGLAGGGFGARPVQVVIGGGSYEQLAQWRDLVLERANQDARFLRPDADYEETKPQLRLEVDRDRAADLGVSTTDVGRTLETVLGSRRVTTFMDRGEEYDVVLEGESALIRTPASVSSIHVRSESSGALVPLGSLVHMREAAAAPSLKRYNRMRAVTVSAGLAPGISLGEGLSALEQIIRSELPGEAQIDYKGESRELRESSSALLFVLALALVVVFLVLAAQFESVVHPLVILLTVPLAVFGALVGLTAFGSSLNVYSQIGIVMLIGLAAKNGILIVEFANQLRDAGRPFEAALREASLARLRPIVMTGISTAIGSLPLVLATGAGSESRQTIGVVIAAGVAFATLFTVVVVPVVYRLLCRRTGSPGVMARRLARLEAESPAE